MNRNARLVDAQTGGVEWRYLRDGTRLHALTDLTNVSAACGVSIWPASAWLGTGSQREYDVAALLRKCRRCLDSVTDR